MSKRTNNFSMLREKRKHANYKPNRRLDAKSSRGMIYENEELRIRTININAEVDRGQSEIKTLKREKEQLRREIWALREEYDKLENLLKMKGIDPDEFLNQNSNNNGDDDEADENGSDYSDCSCESCCEEDCCDDKASKAADKAAEASGDHSKSGETAATSKTDSQQSCANSSKNSPEDHNKRSGKERLNLNFDHLSIVSEENSEVNSIQNEDSSIPMSDLSAYLHNVDVLSPLSYLQKLSPPLAHFENLNYELIGGSNVDQHGNITTVADLKPQQVIDSQPVRTNNLRSISNSNVPVITTDPTTKKESRLKHFFSPIKKKPISTQPIMSQPDVYVSNILPCNMYVNPLHLQNNFPVSLVKPESVRSTETSASPTTSFQTGGNLEELLYDIEALSKDIMDLQTQCTNAPADSASTSKKPFRSELSLVLSYPNQPAHKESPQSPDSNGTQVTPPLPTPMELLNPLSHNNPMLLQNLPSPFPSPIPSSPLTPPTNFKTTDAHLFDKAPDYSHLQFPPINAPMPLFSSNHSIFCTVSAPSTPASDRKCIDKFCINETANSDTRAGGDKKKAKRVSIVNTSKEDADETVAENQEVNNNDSAKDADSREKKADGNAANNHSHNHRNHSHGHPKRRMSLDNTVNSSRHKNHRQICHDPNAKVQRRESNSFKKKSRSDSAFGVHGDDQGGTSMSERYSNSLASSRESSTSLSLKSGKRRISITSYGGSKKIPWCGCWGTSCI